MEPTVYQAPMLHALQYYAVCREIQGTNIPSSEFGASAMVVMDAFLVGGGSIEFPDERATCRKMKRWQATVLTR